MTNVTFDSENVDLSEAADAASVAVGDGDPDTAPRAMPAVGAAHREPVIVVAFLALLPPLASMAQALLGGEEPRAALSALVAALVPVAAKLVRDRVTPVAAPRLDADTPLAIAET